MSWIIILIIAALLSLACSFALSEWLAKHSQNAQPNKRDSNDG